MKSECNLQIDRSQIIIEPIDQQNRLTHTPQSKKVLSKQATNLKSNYKQSVKIKMIISIIFFIPLSVVIILLAKNGSMYEQQSNGQDNQQIYVNPNVVQLSYQSNSSALPINPLTLISNNRSIADILYKDKQIKRNRLLFINERMSFINSNPSYQGINLIKYNLIVSEQIYKESIIQNTKQWLRLQTKFKISNAKKELPMCIITASYNNNARFRIQSNLNSVYTQNYSNFKHIIINDASTDNSSQIYHDYFTFYKISKDKYRLIENKKKATALQNIYNASIYQCHKDAIVIILNGDDQFIGRNTLKLFNWGFQNRRSGVLYSNFYLYLQSGFIKQGFTEQYLQTQKINNLYRNVSIKIGHLLASRAQLFRQINRKDLQEQNGEFFNVNADIVLFLPLMELSCGRVSNIQKQFNLVKTVETGLNDYFLNPNEQKRIHKIIMSKERYDCYKPFDQKMKK